MQYSLFQSVQNWFKLVFISFLTFIIHIILKIHTIRLVSLCFEHYYGKDSIFIGPFAANTLSAKKQVVI